MPELQDHAHAAHLWPAAQHSDLASGIWAFLASISIVQLIKSLLVDRSKSRHNTSCPYSIFTACSEVKVHAKISIVEIFVVFIFACRTCMRNMRKLAPCENFPLYGIIYLQSNTTNKVIELLTNHCPAHLEEPFFGDVSLQTCPVQHQDQRPSHNGSASLLDHRDP